ncbi:hypothetical protein C8J57DRAFT_1241307 [Mycena rebaudengoi]|nr:hypothetical protein C8J57DRAFT_1241307 [Mycena rebaudengoi]
MRFEVSLLKNHSDALGAPRSVALTPLAAIHNTPDEVYAANLRYESNHIRIFLVVEPSNSRTYFFRIPRRVGGSSRPTLTFASSRTISRQLRLCRAGEALPESSSNTSSNLHPISVVLEFLAVHAVGAPALGDSVQEIVPSSSINAYGNPEPSGCASPGVPVQLLGTSLFKKWDDSLMHFPNSSIIDRLVAERFGIFGSDETRD